jgi:hypothetical protein
MKVVRSPICSTSRRDASQLSPGAQSHPSAKDSVPGQKPGASSPVASHGALPEPSLQPEGRHDSIATAVEWHLARHAMLRLGRGE